MSYSTTYLGILASLLGVVGRVWGLPILEADAEHYASAILEIGGLVFVLWRRYMAGGISILGVRSGR